MFFVKPYLSWDGQTQNDNFKKQTVTSEKETRVREEYQPVGVIVILMLTLWE